MMKPLLILLVLLTLSLESLASGCDWDQSYLEKVTLLEFESTGTLRCQASQTCKLTLDNYLDQAVAIVLTGQNQATVDHEKKLNNLNARVVKTIEHGSCYNDGVIISIEVNYDHEAFENYIAVKYP